MQPTILAEAVDRFRREGESGTNWIWFHCASETERKEVDRWLVSIEHPLAYQAGTAEHRFKAIVKELAT